MKHRRKVYGSWLGSLAATGVVALVTVSAYAHCDGLDGPVVTAAKEALAKGDVNRVLIWVQKDDEPGIRKAFEQTMAVRKLGAEAQELADMYFFETVVRVHRAGEGAPFTGLKPAGRDLGPAIPAADQALASGDVAPLTALLVEHLRSGLATRFQQAMATRDFKSQDVDAGREHVERYVTFIHYVEGVHQAALGAQPSHPGEGAAAGHPHE